eukprot:572243-Pleurochrysis_carterae.AAC.2
MYGMINRVASIAILDGPAGFARSSSKKQYSVQTQRSFFVQQLGTKPGTWPPSESSHASCIAC